MFLYDIKDYQKRKNQSIPLPYLLPKIPSNKIFYENGLSKIIHGLHLKVHSHIEECAVLWEKFSPKQCLFDLWDFRYSWWQGYQCTPYFYTIYEGKKPLALLPLWYDSDKKRYEWFGSDWMEENQFFAQDTELINVLLKLVPQSFHLNSIENMPSLLLDEVKVTDDDDKYFQRITRFSRIEDYLATLIKKHRYNLKNDYLKILSLNPRIETIKGDGSVNEFDHVVKLSLQRFNGDVKSDFRFKEDVEACRAILRNSALYQYKFIKVFVQDYLAAVDLIVSYKDTYYMLIGGANDVERFSGIGNFMVYYEFADAIKNNFAVVDCLQVDYGWKHKYFSAKKMVEIEKKV